MHEHWQLERHRWFLLLTLGAIVLAFMALSLGITATGTARFAVAMGYPAEVGYAVGAVFDLAKGLLPIALLLLFARRAFLLFVIIGVAWVGLVIYSALATEATVSTAIAAIERNGSWKAEARSGTKAELAAVEKRLDVLSQPAPPRPTKSLVEALAVEKVPPGVWRDSQECQSIRDSKYFQSACTKVLNLRRELAAAKDYEHLDALAGTLRQALATMPLVATSDPLPEAFAATLGRLLPLDGRVGVSLLLTFVIEIMSCGGLAALGEGVAAQRNHAERPSNVVPIHGAKQHRDPLAGDHGRTRPFSIRRDPSNIGNHIPAFVRQCLRSALGSSLGASELRGSYETWCAVRKYEPVTPTETGRGTEGPRVREVEILRSDPLQGPTTYSLNAPVTFVASRLWLGYS